MRSMIPEMTSIGTGNYVYAFHPPTGHHQGPHFQLTEPSLYTGGETSPPKRTNQIGIAAILLVG